MSVPILGYAAHPYMNPCACGCGELTGRTYCAGHDSRHASVIGRLLADTATDDQLGSQETLAQLAMQHIPAGHEALAYRAASIARSTVWRAGSHYGRFTAQADSARRKHLAESLGEILDRNLGKGWQNKQESLREDLLTWLVGPEPVAADES